eukprot:TRINITY_DN4939_c0_g1_i3.p1 TRINITY_DN4939_c0_g1~~TRINITY_DN4939_c0_g1_i3.p1  ORF type:complete len:359 (+),score=60.05 TRINITY_DN4939_c0_g1_i3:70-1077(+)
MKVETTCGSKRKVTCVACESDMPWDDWMKHKKGKKHRQKVEKSGSDLTEINQRIESGWDTDTTMPASSELWTGDKNEIVMLKMKRLPLPEGDGRVRYLQQPDDTDEPLRTHEYVNANSEWRVHDGTIRDAETAKYIVPGAKKDALSMHLTLSESIEESDKLIITKIPEGVTVEHPVHGFLTCLPSGGSFFSSRVAFHKAPRSVNTHWEIVCRRTVDTDKLFRGRIKLYSECTMTGFIECPETHAIFHRDVFIDNSLAPSLLEDIRENKEEIPDRNDGVKANSVLWRVVDFQVSIDEHRGHPRAENIQLSTPDAAAQWCKAGEEKRKLKNILGKGS